MVPTLFAEGERWTVGISGRKDPAAPMPGSSAMTISETVIETVAGPSLDAPRIVRPNGPRHDGDGGRIGRPTQWDQRRRNVPMATWCSGRPP